MFQVDRDKCAAPVAFEPVGDVFVMRGDRWSVGNAVGVKALVMLETVRRTAAGSSFNLFVTAGHRQGTQGIVGALVAKYLGVPFEFHCPTGSATPVMEAVVRNDGRIVQHRPGYRGVLNARGLCSANRVGGVFIPAWMESELTVHIVAGFCRSVDSWPPGRLVVPTGSGMTLAGILVALRRSGRRDLRVLGVAVGADPESRLDKYTGFNWRWSCDVVRANGRFGASAVCNWRGLSVDPIYSSKALPYLRPGDLFWNGGARQLMGVSV